MNVRVTNEVLKLLSANFNKFTLSEELGISRPTLDKRLKNHDWKKSEAALVDKIK